MTLHFDWNLTTISLFFCLHPPWIITVFPKLTVCSLSIITQNVNKIDNVVINIEVCLCLRVRRTCRTWLRLQCQLWLLVWVARFVCSIHSCLLYVYYFLSLVVICWDQTMVRLCWALCTIPPVFLSVRSSISPSLWLTNTGAAFQQCPLSKHLYCGVLLPLLCQTKPPCQWYNPAGLRPSPGSFGAAVLHLNGRPDSPSPATIAGQEINFVYVSAGSKRNPKFTSHAHLFTWQIFF